MKSATEVPESLSASDWATIRAAYEARRHAAVGVEGEQRARNPGQQWLTRFDGRGFLVCPDQGTWHWGLQLESYGFAGEVRRIAHGPKIKAEGQRVTYSWDGKVEEWFVNDQRGLEHGFTVRQRPAGAASNSQLEFSLAVRGDLQPSVSADGNAITFADASGVAVITYSELKVLDADGKTLPAHFETEHPEKSSSIKLVVDERDARYPLTIDPVAQQAYLKASNTDSGDEFGWSVAISGDTVVVGALGEDSNATGINGDQTNNSKSASGAAYVFVRSGTTWTQQAYLKASNTDSDDEFGWSVAISGDTVVVGALGEASNATGVNGDQTNNSAPSSGAAYVFVRNGTTWTQQAYLKASNTGGEFGQSVAISGDTLVVGAVFESSNATGINGDQTNNGAPSSGAAYVFVRNGTTWTQQAYLKASNTDAGDHFGQSVTISGNTVVAGAYGESSNATGIDGDQTNNSADLAGAAYVFVRSGLTWTQQAYLKASNTDLGDDEFGWSVAISGDTVVVGAPAEDGGPTNSGAAYIFVRNGTTWAQQAYLKASNPDPSDEFGWSVASSGDTVLVGALGEASGATGINGDQTNNNVSFAGAAYVFVRNGTTWTQQAYLKASNTDAGDHVGWSVAVSGDTVVVGAPSEASNAIGVNGNQTDNSKSGSGAVYVFTGFTPPPAALAQNLSTRMQVLTGDNLGIGGFIITGSPPKHVVVRAIGPSLTKFGITNVLADPMLKIVGAGNFGSIVNDNWRDSQEAQLRADGLGPSNELESAIDAVLPAGAYTAQVTGKNGGIGIALIEVYDLDTTPASKLANLSTRAFVGTDNNVVIAGFILGKNAGATRIVSRGIGPSLASFGVPAPLANPFLELRNANGTLIRANDDWQDDPVQVAQITASDLAPSNDKESAIAATLTPDFYTAVLSGVNNSTGNAVVEVYDLGAP